MYANIASRVVILAITATLSSIAVADTTVGADAKVTRDNTGTKVEAGASVGHESKNGKVEVGARVERDGRGNTSGSGEVKASIRFNASSVLVPTVPAEIPGNPPVLRPSPKPWPSNGPVLLGDKPINQRVIGDPMPHKPTVISVTKFGSVLPNQDPPTSTGPTFPRPPIVY